MKLFLSLSFALIFSVTGRALVMPFGTSSYLGLGGGFVISKGVGRSLISPQNDGLYYVKGKTLGMSFALTRLGGSQDKKFHLGYYVSSNLGVYLSKWYIVPTDAVDRNIYWQDGFDIMGNFALGLQCAYYSQEKDLVIGFRYFNNYSGDGLRGAFGNSDDAACVGLFAGNDKFGLDASYASDAIPGVLVDSDVWTYVMTDFRYCISTWDDDMMTFYAGIHHEYSIMKDPNSVINLGGEKTGFVNSFLFTVGIGINKNK